jgi:hypothetical protein
MHGVTYATQVTHRYSCQPKQHKLMGGTRQPHHRRMCFAHSMSDNMLHTVPTWPPDKLTPFSPISDRSPAGKVARSGSSAHAVKAVAYLSGSQGGPMDRMLLRRLLF